MTGGVDELYARFRRELGLDGVVLAQPPVPPPSAVERTQLMPAVRPGEDDHLAQRTFNGLRPADLAWPQPPQHPDWRADGHD